MGNLPVADFLVKHFHQLVPAQMLCPWDAALDWSELDPQKLLQFPELCKTHNKSFKVLWITSLSEVTFEQWQFMVSTKQLGPSVKARRPLAHGNRVLAQIGNREVKSKNRANFWYVISANCISQGVPLSEGKNRVLGHEEKHRIV